MLTWTQAIIGGQSRANWKLTVHLLSVPQNAFLSHFMFHPNNMCVEERYFVRDMKIFLTIWRYRWCSVACERLDVMRYRVTIVTCWDTFLPPHWLITPDTGLWLVERRGDTESWESVIEHPQTLMSSSEPCHTSSTSTSDNHTNRFLMRVFSILSNYKSLYNIFPSEYICQACWCQCIVT